MFTFRQLTWSLTPDSHSVIRTVKAPVTCVLHYISDKFELKFLRHSDFEQITGTDRWKDADAVQHFIVPIEQHTGCPRERTRKTWRKGFLEKTSFKTLEWVIHRVSKNKQNYFVITTSQTSTKSDNFWHKDGKLSKIIWGALIFHLICV